MAGGVGMGPTFDRRRLEVPEIEVLYLVAVVVAAVVDVVVDVAVVGYRADAVVDVVAADDVGVAAAA